MALHLSDYREDDEEAESLLLAMLFPPGSHCDDNPLFILCRNDPCSFTWTGEEHINQVQCNGCETGIKWSTHFESIEIAAKL